MNPLHTGPGVGYSDAFLSLAVPLVVLLALSFTLRGRVESGDGSPGKGCAADVRGNI